MNRVIYVVFSEKDEKVYRSLVSEYFPGPRHEDDSNTAPMKHSSKSVEQSQETPETSSKSKKDNADDNDKGVEVQKQ